MAQEKYRVKLPTGKTPGYVGRLTFYGFTFINGVAEDVTPGTGLDEFKDWGCEVEPMKVKRDVVVSEEEVQKAVRQLSVAHKRAKADDA